MGKKLDWEARNYWKLGPNFGLDIKNPEFGLDGPNVYTFYATTENGYQHSFGLSDGTGTFQISNDRSIQITAGKYNNAGSVDIIITSQTGDITITAEKNGSVRISGKNITLNADLDVTIIAGRNVNINSAKRCVVQSNQADIIAKAGNAAPKGSTVGEKSFPENPICGIDLVESAFNAGDPLVG